MSTPRTSLGDQNQNIQEGIESFRKGLYLKAVKSLQQGVTESSTPTSLSYYFLGSSLNKLGKHQEAIESLQQALELEKNSPEIYLDLGTAYFNTEQHEKALAAFEKALELEPGNASAHFFKGLSLQAMEESDRAINSFDKAGDVDPEFRQLSQFNIALLRYNQGKYDEAKTGFGETIQTDPQSELAKSAREFLDIMATQKPDKPWRAAFRAGASIDDNVTLTNINSTTGLEDSLSFYQFSGSYFFEPFETFTLGAGYDFYQSLYDTFKQFDMQIHTGYTSLTKAFGDVDLSFGYTFNYIALGGDDFENIHTVSSGLSFEVLPDWFLNMTYAFTIKDFYDIAQRDGFNHSLTIGNYFSLDDRGTLLWMTYIPEGEITRDDQVTYVAQNVSTGVDYPLPFKSLKTRIRTSYLFTYRDYLFNTPLINTERLDFQHQLSFEIIQPFLDYFDATFQYRYLNSASNLPANDLVENVFTLSVGATF